MATEVFGTLSEHLNELATQYEHLYDANTGEIHQLAWHGDDKYEAADAFWTERLIAEPTAEKLYHHEYDVETELCQVRKALYEVSVDLELDPKSIHKKEERARLLRRMQQLYMLRKVITHMGDAEYDWKRNIERALYDRKKEAATADVA